MVDTEIEIREMTEGDIDEVALQLLYVQSLHVKAHPEIYRVLSIDDARLSLQERLNSKNIETYVAVVRDEVVGHILFEYMHREGTLFTHPREFIYIHQISVLENNHRQGIGKKLISKVKERAAIRKNIKRIELDVWEFNENAKIFFAKQGLGSLSSRMNIDP